ncbi:dihydroxyacetone kinase subunit DhaK [Streptomyces sp. NPDC001508]|uniref:dihydroxyacetone kinase subunit DhaK n=1 Tax=Streptomyces sp. NPDC001508 TaxID=3154656 RepID=UPI003334188F
MKKIQNSPQSVVDETLAAFAEVHARYIRADVENRVVLRSAPPPKGTVALVSGGGSGHEPLHSGFVGEGMLTAAVLGDIFASPSSHQVARGAIAAHAGGGVLLIAKNYTGDVLNFRVAAEVLEDEGISVSMVVVDDDAALPAFTDGPGRRGTAATVFVEKIAGAAAEAGRPLGAVTDIAQNVIARSRSIGFALSACTTPMAGKPTFRLGDGEIEFGVGIHGEKGLRRQPLPSSAELARQAVQLLTEDFSAPGGSEVLVFTNGLGASPDTELYPLHGDVLAALRGHGLNPVRHLVGSYVTSLDMAGASISLLWLDDESKALWDAPVNTPALKWS